MASLFELRGYTITFLPPQTSFGLHALMVVGVEIALASLLAVATYYGVVVVVGGTKDKNGGSSSFMTAFLVGFGVVIPLSMWIPWVLMDVMGVDNVAVRMTLVPPPMLVSLRCLEAMAGFTPKVAQSSLKQFVYYAGLFLKPKMTKDGQEVEKATRQSIQKQLAMYGFGHIVFFVLFSWLKPHQYEPCPTQRPSTDIFITLDTCQLVNNFLAALLMSLSLYMGLAGIAAIVQLVAGVQTEPIVENPLLASTSPSDFWGRRWNRLVHNGLKQAIYKPVRRLTSSKSLAALAAFAVSGLLHEYVWLILFYQTEHPQPPFGKQLLFFGWSGILILVEYAIGQERWHRWTRPLPNPIVTLLVICMGLPVGHLFTGDMVAKGSYMDGLSRGVAMIRVSKST